jgi:hypothetical protein
MSSELCWCKPLHLVVLVMNSAFNPGYKSVLCKGMNINLSYIFYSKFVFKNG